MMKQPGVKVFHGSKGYMYLDINCMYLVHGLNFVNNPICDDDIVHTLVKYGLKAPPRTS